MTRLLLIFILAVVSLASAHASEPGQPLDCTDWVFLEPGLSCSAYIQNCADPANLWSGQVPVMQVDNEGYRYAYTTSNLPDSCNQWQLERWELRRFDGHSEKVIAYVDDRCGAPGFVDHWNPSQQYFVFDEEKGRLYLKQETFSCDTNGTQCTTVYPHSTWVLAIDGFTSTFEILQTYEPTSNEISFRVPYMPEGFQAADYFDTYYGPLPGPIDFTQAQPLECGYPATPPSVGDYLTVADPLPTPQPGEGYWYVTAVTYQGQTRYGRKAMGGVLSGRDSALLPGCVE